MMRWRSGVAALVALGACSGGGGNGGTGPTPVTPVTTTVSVALSATAVTVGGTATATATALDQNGAALGGRTVTWSSSASAVATVGATGQVQALSAGTASIVATIDGKSGQAALTVATAPVAGICTPASALQLAIGEVRILSAAQKASLCLGQTAASEYVLIPFNNSTVAASTTSVSVTSTGTLATTVTPLASLSRSASIAVPGLADHLYETNTSFEAAFRERERRELTPLLASRRGAMAPGAASIGISTHPNRLTGIGALPSVGSIVSLNTNLSAPACAAKVPKAARVVSVGTKSIVLIDTLAPAGGYTDAELTAFGTAFDTLVFALDTSYFGAPTDIDGNGRIAIFFTPDINKLATGAGYIGGLQFSRDLFPATATSQVAGCAGSNEGEMFYMAVPDPMSSNAGYKNKANLANTVVTTLMHEFQHTINGGRRIYVNNASSFEDVWLNEGLSHISEELIYYKASGQTPGSNLDVAALRASQAQINAFNTYVSQNFGRLKAYLSATESFSPYALVDGLEMRGAIWELLRYSVDRKGGSERTLWYNLVNSSVSGQANFNAVLGDITALTRDWAVAQFLNDASINNQAIYSYPSWNFRSIFPALGTNGSWPLATRPLVSPSAVTFSIVGGGAAYLRFRVAAGLPATISGASAGQPLPANIDFILVRTQ